MPDNVKCIGPIAKHSSPNQAFSTPWIRPRKVLS